MQKGYCLVSIKIIIKMHGLGRYLKFRNKDKIFSLYPVLIIITTFRKLGPNRFRCFKLYKVKTSRCTVVYINTVKTAFELNFDFYQSFKQHMIHINIETNKKYSINSFSFFSEVKNKTIAIF